LPQILPTPSSPNSCPCPLLAADRKETSLKVQAIQRGGVSEPLLTPPAFAFEDDDEDDDQQRRRQGGAEEGEEDEEEEGILAEAEEQQVACVLKRAAGSVGADGEAHAEDAGASGLLGCHLGMRVPSGKGQGLLLGGGEAEGSSWSPTPEEMQRQSKLVDEYRAIVAAEAQQVRECCAVCVCVCVCISMFVCVCGREGVEDGGDARLTGTTAPRLRRRPCRCPL
jgi:hypothetical protein